ncbi:DUF3267 domain-containing protein [Pseudalkalibacillus caeni]|uniref:DUF3267 domain-containing protein n=1 Tax=Exobacillus caeni TaxID=2574798 RepID=A0A5R9FAZ7_9BACL|nr:DUF3267 domain-containing protein [Pseudalkalibacillus caeni]TLS38053.1 DUF3267 domain-containing protein [Pseudalkalibacillus caeni]
MSCWKSIDLFKEYGVQRIFLFSFIVTMLCFISLYLFFSVLQPNTKHVIVPFFPFLGSIVLLLFVHKVLHCLPLWLSGIKTTVRIENITRKLPIVRCEIERPVSRALYLIAVLSPAISITVTASLLSALFPAYMAFFAILSSINIGLSCIDLIYAIQVLRAPRHAFVEDHSEGFHILVKQAS